MIPESTMNDYNPANQMFSFIDTPSGLTQVQVKQLTRSITAMDEDDNKYVLMEY